MKRSAAESPPPPQQQPPPSPARLRHATAARLPRAPRRAPSSIDRPPPSPDTRWRGGGRTCRRGCGGRGRRRPTGAALTTDPSALMGWCTRARALARVCARARAFAHARARVSGKHRLWRGARVCTSGCARACACSGGARVWQPHARARVSGKAPPLAHTRARVRAARSK